MTNLNLKKIGVVLIGLMMISIVLAGAAGADGQHDEKITYHLAEGYTLPDNEEITLPLLSSEEEQEEPSIVNSDDFLFDNDSPLPDSYDSSLPESFDLRKYGCVTPVRDQGDFGVCWSFSMIGAIESNVLMHKYLTGDDAKNLNLSELQLVYFIVERLGVTFDNPRLMQFEGLGDYYTYLNEWTKLKMSYKSDKALNQLAAGIGIASEEDDALKYDMMDYYFVDVEYLDPLYAISENSYYPVSIFSPSSKNPDEIKKCLMKYGASTISYFDTDTMLEAFAGHEENGAIVPERYCTESVYQNEKTTTNHEVTLIGWDDNYKKENFPNYLKTGVDEEGRDIIVEIPRPQNDGAWLIKNSWGTMDYTDIDGKQKVWDGYLWISYEDPSLDSINFIDVVPANSFYDKIYQYDLGNHLSGIMSSDKTYEPGQIQTIASKNVYTAERNEKLTAVHFATNGYGETYSIDILVNGKSALTAPISGTEKYPGRYTLNIPEKIIVDKGDEVSVILELSKITPSDGLKLFTAVNVKYEKDDEITEYAETDIPGRSYVRYDGDTTWTDISTIPTIEGKDCYLEYGPACIKLFAQEYIEEIKVPFLSSITSLWGIKGTGDSWYDEFSGTGPLYFQVPPNVSDVKRWAVIDVPLFDAKTDVGTDTKPVSVEISGVFAMKVGDTTVFKAANSDGSSAKFAWKSSDDSVATIDENGNLKALKAGTVTITVTNPNTGKSASKTITVAAKEEPEKQTAKTPFPILGILAGLGAAGVLVMRRKN